MTEIGEVMKSLDIPGADDPPEDVLAAANEAASVGGGGLWRKVRHKWVVGLIALGLVGVPTAFALSSNGGNPNRVGVDMDQVEADQMQILEALRRDTPEHCNRALRRLMPVECITTFDSVPVKDLAATQASERPITGKVGSTLRNAEERQREIPSR